MEREFEEGRVLDVAHATILCWGSAARRDGRPAPSSGDRDRPAHRPPPPGEASRWIGVTTWSRSSRPAAGLRRAAGGTGACFAARPPNCQPGIEAGSEPGTRRRGLTRRGATSAVLAHRRWAQPLPGGGLAGPLPYMDARPDEARGACWSARLGDPAQGGAVRPGPPLGGRLAEDRLTLTTGPGPVTVGYHGTTPPSRARLQALARCNYLPRIRPRATGALGSSGRRGATPANDCPAHGRPS